MCSPHCGAYNTLCRDTSVKDASKSHGCAYESGLCYFSDRCVHYIVMYVINHVKTYFFKKRIPVAMDQELMYFSFFF